MRPMDDNTRDELMDIADKLQNELRLVETYIENHDGIKDSTWKDIDQLLSRVYSTLYDLKNTINYS